VCARSREGGDERVLIDAGSLTNHYDAGNLNVATDLGATSPRHATRPGLANRAKNLGRKSSGLRVRPRQRSDNAGEMMSQIMANRPAEHLAPAGFFVV
jgi:hypothetical protein